MSYGADDRDHEHAGYSGFQICGGWLVRKIAIFRWFIVHSALEKSPPTRATQGNTSVIEKVEDAKGKDGPCRLCRLSR